MAPMHVNRPVHRSRLSAKTRAADRGSALVMAVIVSVVVMAMAGALLAFANHQSSASRNDSVRQQSIDAAMAGLVVADASLAKTPSYVGTGGVVTIAEGGAQYEITVVPDPAVTSGLQKIITSTAYVPSKLGATSTRKVQQIVVLDPVGGGGGFTYAIYTTGSLKTSSGVDCSTTPGPCVSGGGGMFTSAAINLPNDGMTYNGDMTTTGNITTSDNQIINGTLRSGGGVDIGAGTHVYGNVFSGNLSIGSGGKIHGNALVSGDIPGAANDGQKVCTSPFVTGTCLRYTTPPPIVIPVQPNPVFTWNPANYPAGVTGPMPASDLVDLLNKRDSKGVFWVAGGRIKFPSDGALWLTGDMTIYTQDTTLLLPPVVLNKSGGPVQLTVLGTNGIDAPKFSVPDTVKVLLYGGTSSITINTDAGAGDRPMTGIIYNERGAVTLGSNSSMTFSPVSAPGFNFPEGSGGAASTFAIRNISTREITGS